MSQLMDRKREHETACEQAIRDNALGLAAYHAAKAADYAFALARQTEGAIAERHVADGEAWLEHAELLKSRADRMPAAPTGRTGGSGGSTPRQGETDENAAGDEEWQVTEKSGVTFEMIAGMQVAKEAIRDMVINPLKAPEKAKILGLKAGGGVLLYGPPGTGKTMLGKAVATELDCPFFYADGASIRSKWHGESEQRLSRLIHAAQARPMAVLFLDELDGLLPRRSSGGSVVDARIVTQFLADIGGFRKSDNILLILAATNKPWEIDEAVFRTGRFDEKIYIGPPDPDARAKILGLHLDGVPTAPDIDRAAWVARLDGFSGSDIVAIVIDAKRACHSRSVREDSDPQLRAADLEQALTTIPSSITPALLKQYEQFRKARFG